MPATIGIPFDLLQQVDELANDKNLSRSSYVVEALREKVKRDTEGED